MKEAENHAAAYAAQAPSVPHAVHMHGHELRRLGRINEAIARFEAADKLQRDYLAREKIARRVRLAPRAQSRSAGGVVSIHRPDEEGRGAAEAVVQPADEPAGAGGQQARVAGVPARARASRRGARPPRKRCSRIPILVVQATGHIEAGFAQLAMNRPADGATSSNAALRALRSAQAGQGPGGDRARGAAGRVHAAHRAAREGPPGDGARRAEVAVAPWARRVDASRCSGSRPWRGRPAASATGRWRRAWRS